MSLSKLPIKALEAFEATARTGSLARAAKEVDLSISAVSHHLSRLEASLGTVLLDRTRRPVRLTAAGADALRRIEEGLRHIRSAGLAVMDGADVGRGLRSGARRLKIGLPGASDGPLGPALAADLAKAAPGPRLTVIAEPGHRAVRLVQLRRIDAAVSDDPPRPPAGLLRRPLMLQPLVLALPADLASEGARVLDGASAPPVVLVAPRRPLGRQIATHLRRLGVDRRQALALDDARAALAVVARGAGWAVLPAAFCLGPELSSGDVALRPLPEPASLRPVSFFARREGPQAEAMAAVFEIARRRVERDVAAPLADRWPWLAGAVLPSLPEGDRLRPG